MDKLPRRFPSGQDLHLPVGSVTSFRKRLRSWLRGRTGRIVLPCLGLVLGVLLGMSSLLLYLSSIPSNPPLPSPAPRQQGAITVTLGKDYLTQVVKRNLAESNIPGKITNVQVNLAPNDRMTITGDDAVSGVLGLGVTQPFTVNAQTTVLSCQPHIHILSVMLGQIPLTSAASSFENQINQAVTLSPASLPPGFIYCATSLRVQPQGLVATFSAVPIS